tara:strand:+ start:763 stop:1164 length:402 start_codon:yes stop_codon:yes gene_type:complete
MKKWTLMGVGIFLLVVVLLAVFFLPKGGLSGTYQREDGGMGFKLVLEESGTFKDYFENFPSKTLTEQASGDWKLVHEEVHLSYQTPANYAKRGLIHIYSVQEDGSLSQIAGIADGKRHELSKEQQAEVLDWMK